MTNKSNQPRPENMFYAERKEITAKEVWAGIVSELEHMKYFRIFLQSMIESNNMMIATTTPGMIDAASAEQLNWHNKGRAQALEHLRQVIDLNEGIAHEELELIVKQENTNKKKE